MGTGPEQVTETKTPRMFRLSGANPTEALPHPFASLRQKTPSSATFLYRRSPGGIGKDCATERGPIYETPVCQTQHSDNTSTELWTGLFT